MQKGVLCAPKAKIRYYNHFKDYFPGADPGFQPLLSELSNDVFTLEIACSIKKLWPVEILFYNWFVQVDHVHVLLFFMFSCKLVKSA